MPNSPQSAATPVETKTEWDENTKSWVTRPVSAPSGNGDAATGETASNTSDNTQTGTFDASQPAANGPSHAYAGHHAHRGSDRAERRDTEATDAAPTGSDTAVPSPGVIPPSTGLQPGFDPNALLDKAPRLMKEDNFSDNFKTGILMGLLYMTIIGGCYTAVLLWLLNTDNVTDCFED